jgi:hypothetical protein
MAMKKKQLRPENTQIQHLKLSESSRMMMTRKPQDHKCADGGTAG